MRRILVVTHEAEASAGRVGDELVAGGFHLQHCRPFAGETLPEAVGEYAGVVVFGGRMSANDEHLDYIRAELQWIPKVLSASTPYLGICLGGQLLARVLGASVAPHADGLHEIGYTRIRPTAAGIGHFPLPMHFYQWHGEGFDVPRGAELLAAGDVFANQAFRFGRAFGVQFHPEVTRPILERWTRDRREMNLPGAIGDPEAHLAGWRQHDGAVAIWLKAFLNDWFGSDRAVARA